MPLIQVQDLTWGYDKENVLFDKFNFSLVEKDFCFVMGRSGVGKTTLVKFLMRQITPPLRTVFHGKDDISRYSNSEVQKYRRNVGVIFQDFKLIDWKTVKQNLEYPLAFADISRKEKKQRVDEIISRLGLTEQKDHLIPTLSGGEKQRVAIGRALIADPEFIIADEPTGNLDFESGKMTADLLIESNNDGNTILCITHNQALVDYVCSKHDVTLITID